jgi:succinate dehydrogenase/fumarate reductase iron-sulfur protein
MSTIRVRIRRFDPDTDQAPRYESFEVPHAPEMRVLDVLDYVHEQLAQDVAYRWFCGVKRCGTCAVTVNGSPKLACWEAAEPDMTIEPLANLPVVRDLVVERTPCREGLCAIEPLIRRREAYPGFPEPLSYAAMQRGYHLRDCILCLACHAACPVMAQPGTKFAGPAVLVNLAEVALDPRDGADRAHIAENASVFSCVSCYECERVCPAEIPIVRDAIEPLKRLVYRRGAGAGARHARLFLESVKKHGRVDAPQLVLATRGADLGALGTGLRMMARGKVNPMKSILKGAAAGADTLRKLYEANEVHE